MSWWLRSSELLCAEAAAASEPLDIAAPQDPPALREAPPEAQAISVAIPALETAKPPKKEARSPTPLKRLLQVGCGEMIGRLHARCCGSA